MCGKGCRHKGGFDGTSVLLCSKTRCDPAMSSQAPVPARCGRGSYRAADGCKSCVAADSPFTKFYGGV